MRLQVDVNDARACLVPTGALRVGIAVGPASSAVWTVRDAVTGQPQGVTVEIGAAMAACLRVPLALVEHASSGAIIAAAASGTWDVAFTPVDEDRKRMVEFGPNYYLGVSTYMVAASSEIRTLADVDRPGTRVVGVEDTATIRSARRTLSATTVTGVAKLDEAIALFQTGQADAIALGGESIRSMLPQFPGARMLDESFHSAGTAVAVPKGRHAALAAATTLLELLKRDGTVRRAFNAHGMAAADIAPEGSRS